jgi:hypothetical protein
MPEWLQTTLWIAGGLLVVFVVVGMLLPREFEVARSIVIAAPAAKIHPHIDSLDNWPAWSPFDTEDPSIVWEKKGPQSGVGARRAWKSKKMGDGEQTITASDPATGLSMKLAMAGGCMEPFDIRFDYAPQAGGTKVTWTDRGRLPSGPHWRWMGLLVVGPMCGKQFEKGLRALKAKVEKA